MKGLGKGKITIWQTSSILRHIHKKPGITRAELSTALKIDKSATSNITSFLEQNGWISCDRSGGKNLPLVLNHKRLTIAGVLIQPEFCTLVICDLSGTVLHEETWREKNASLETILTVVIPYRLHVSGFRIDALGIALPGIVDENERVLLASQPFGIDSPLRLPDRVGSRDFPVFFANDAQCIGWGQVSFAQETEDFFLHYLSFVENEPPSDSFARIIHGSALFFGGSAFTGSHKCAGELRIKSHLSFAGSGERYIDHQTRLKMKTDREVMDRYFDGIAFNIAYAAMFIDVPKIYLFGSLEGRGSEFGGKIASLARKISYYPGLQKVSVMYPGLKDSTIPTGACAMAIERLFSLPSIEGGSEFYRSVIERTL